MQGCAFFASCCSILKYCSQTPPPTGSDVPLRVTRSYIRPRIDFPSLDKRRRCGKFRSSVSSCDSSQRAQLVSSSSAQLNFSFFCKGEEVVFCFKQVELQMPGVSSKKTLLAKRQDIFFGDDLIRRTQGRNRSCDFCGNPTKDTVDHGGLGPLSDPSPLQKDLPRFWEHFCMKWTLKPFQNPSDILLRSGSAINSSNTTVPLQHCSEKCVEAHTNWRKSCLLVNFLPGVLVVESPIPLDPHLRTERNPCDTRFSREFSDGLGRLPSGLNVHSPHPEKF